MSPLEALSDEELFDTTKTRVGLALRAHPKSRGCIQLWSGAYDCQEEWKRRGKEAEYYRAYQEEKKEAKR